MSKMKQKFDELLAEIRRSRWEVEDKLSSSMAKIKCELTAAQEKTSQEVTKKISNTTYQFKKKGHEHQYCFNCRVEEAINSARRFDEDEIPEP